MNSSASSTVKKGKYESRHTPSPVSSVKQKSRSLSPVSSSQDESNGSPVSYKGRNSEVMDDETAESTDSDEDLKAIRETERALRSLSGDFDGEFDSGKPYSSPYSSDSKRDKSKNSKDKSKSKKSEKKKPRKIFEEKEELIEDTVFESENNTTAAIEEPQIEESVVDNTNDESTTPDVVKDDSQVDNIEDTTEAQEDAKQNNEDKKTGANLPGSDDLENLLKIELQCATLQSSLSHDQRSSSPESRLSFENLDEEKSSVNTLLDVTNTYNKTDEVADTITQDDQSLSGSSNEELVTKNDSESIVPTGGATVDDSSNSVNDVHQETGSCHSDSVVLEDSDDKIVEEQEMETQETEMSEEQQTTERVHIINTVNEEQDEIMSQEHQNGEQISECKADDHEESNQEMDADTVEITQTTSNCAVSWQQESLQCPVSADTHQTITESVAMMPEMAQPLQLSVIGITAPVQSDVAAVLNPQTSSQSGSMSTVPSDGVTQTDLLTSVSEVNTLVSRTNQTTDQHLQNLGNKEASPEKNNNEEDAGFTVLAEWTGTAEDKDADFSDEDEDAEAESPVKQQPQHQALVSALTTQTMKPPNHLPLSKLAQQLEVARLPPEPFEPGTKGLTKGEMLF